MKGTIFDIKRFAIHDGPGIRLTVFFKGCPLSCWWCHNPEGINPKIDGETGEEVTVDQLMVEIQKEIIFFEESSGGVTFSGGEPLMQAPFLAALLDRCGKCDIHTAVDTSGCVPINIFNTIIDKVDLFLYDLKIMDRGKHLKFTGSYNDHTIENLENLAKKGKDVLIRFPLIPGITDSTENIQAVASFIQQLKALRQVEILPYHKMAAHKYKKINRPNKIGGLMPPSSRQIREAAKIFCSFGLDVVNEFGNNKN
jgi:pyruvate formate lyase activating enzyme